MFKDLVSWIGKKISIETLPICIYFAIDSSDRRITSIIILTIQKITEKIKDLNAESITSLSCIHPYIKSRGKSICCYYRQSMSSSKKFRASYVLSSDQGVLWI